MAAYAPIAVKIFGSAHVGTWLKLHFLYSLVLNRLLYKVQLWLPEPKSMLKLNVVYMRVLRRIDGCVRYDSTCERTDYEVRERLGQPSIDCLLVKARLKYLGRLVRIQHPTLLAILSATCCGRRLRWVTQVINDLNMLHAFAAEVDVKMPSPSSEPVALFAFIRD
eukprot:1707249-Karenia_brevis.AAC.1